MRIGACLAPTSAVSADGTCTGPLMIPATAHFIWFGPRLPWANALSIRTAALRGGFERIVLHASDDLSSSPGYEALIAASDTEIRRIDPPAIFEAAGVRVAELTALFDRLTQPAARANMLRAAILHAEGGVYLDLDTITVRDVTPLRERCGAFVGLEHIALPVEVAANVKRRPDRYAVAGIKIGLRHLFRLAPNGWRGFRRIEGLFAAAANNAIVGAAPGHSLTRSLLEGMADAPPHRQLVRYALGTHLLQQVVNAGVEDDVEVCPPAVFFPLGPEISEQWFRRADAADLDEVLRPETLIVHWYASVRTKQIVPQIDRAYVERHADTQLFSALAARILADEAHA